MPISIVSTTVVTGVKGATTITSGNISALAGDVICILGGCTTANTLTASFPTGSGISAITQTTNTTAGNPASSIASASCSVDTTFTARLTVGASSALAAIVYVLRGADSPYNASSSVVPFTSGTAPSAGPISIPNGAIAIGSMAVLGPTTDGYTADSDTTNGTWTANVESGTTGGGATSNISLNSQAKIVNATGNQTYNATLGTARVSTARLNYFTEKPITPFIGWGIPIY